MDASTPQDGSRHIRFDTIALASWTAGLLVVVTTDGAPAGRVLRALVVAGLAFAVHLVARRWDRRGGAALVAAGIVGVDAGITFGGRYLIDDGVSVVSLAGVLTLAAGIALLVIGGRRLTDLPGRRRFVAVPVLVLTVAVIVWNTMPAVLATNVPPIARGPDRPADHGLDAEDVRFEAADGTELAAWYVPSQNGAAVVLRHGAGSTADANLAQAAAIAGHGYGVLVTDARGHGESGGRAMDFGWFGDRDIEGAVDFLVGRPEIDPTRIGVVGFSMGGEEAIGAFAADPRIRTVVAEGATGRTDADQVWFADVYGWRGRLQQPLEWVEFTLTDLLTEASKPTSLADAAAASAPRRLLLVTAGNVPDELHAAEHVRAAAPDRVTVRTIDGADHTGGYTTDARGWETMVVGWLDAELAP